MPRGWATGVKGGEVACGVEVGSEKVATGEGGGEGKGGGVF